MKIRKTRQDKRETYKFEFYTENEGCGCTKECIELRPGEDGVTEYWIKTLHCMDDHEVYLNCKNGHPPMTEAEKAAKREWEEAHLGEKYIKNWNLSLDYMASDDDSAADKSSILKDNSYSMEEDVTADVQQLRDIVETMTEKQQLVYKLHVLEGYSFTEIAKLTGTSIPNVKKHYDKAIMYIKNNFKKYFHEVKKKGISFACDM